MKPISDDEYLELSLVGSLLMSPALFPEVSAILNHTHFLGGSASRVWLEMSKVYRNGNIDMADVYVALQDPSDKEWFHTCTSEIMPLGKSAIFTAKKIAEAAKKRRILAAVKEIAEKGTSAQVTADWLLEDIIAAYKSETGEVDRDSSIGAVVDRFRKVQAKNVKNGRLGMRTGFDLLQRDYIVYQPGHLWVIGAWTSVGKTQFMVEAINRFLVENEEGRVAVFSTEMTEEQNVARLLANRTGVNANVILGGQLLDNHSAKVDQQAAWISGRSLHIFDKLRNIDDIMAQCRKIKYGGGVDLIWIDFIQNVYRPGAKDQYVMTSQIAKDIQALAHDLRCTIVCLSQLPNHAGREDTGILEFKGAGEIAAACDVGVLMKRSKDDNSTILFDVRKNRHGKCGKYLLQFAEGWTKINELEAVA